LGSHIHIAAIKSQVSDVANDIGYQTLITPSISPIYNNNPSFTHLQLDETDLKITEAISHSFDLTSYTLFQGKHWTKIDW